MKEYQILIIPGGQTIRLVQNLGESGHIRHFISKGSVHIGICAGAYLATERVEASGRPRGIDLIPVTMKRRSGIGSREIF